MAINLLLEPTAGAPVGVADYNKQNAIQQALHGLNEFNNVLTNWETTTQPKIAVGARIIHDGGLYECQSADETISGAPADGHVYIKITEAAGVLTASFVTADTGYTYDPIKGGWYHADGTQLLPFKLYKYDSTSWKKSKILMTNFNETSDLSSCQVYPWAGMENIVKDDSSDSIPLPAGLTYWSFGSPKICNSVGIAPTVRHNIEFKPAGTAEAKFAGRGTTYHNLGFSLWSHTFGNEMTIALRIYPKFAYNVAQNTFILDSRGLSGSSDDSFYLYYDQGTDKLTFIVRDDATHLLTITTDAYVNNAALQIPHDIYIRWSKANNDGDMYINNVRQGGGVAGTKTMTGNISSLNITKTSFVIGASAFAAGWYANYDTTLFYIQDLIISSTYVTTWLDNYDGSTVYPYWITTWLSGEKHDWQIDTYGNAGFNHVATEKGILGSADIGAGQMKEKIFYWSSWNMDTTSPFNVAHGLGSNYTKIVFCQCWVAPNAANLWSDLNYAGAGGISIDSTNIILFRAPGGAYDAAGYNAAYGIVMIKYLV